VGPGLGGLGFSSVLAYDSTAWPFCGPGRKGSQVKKLVGIACVLAVLVLPASASAVTGRPAEDVEEILVNDGIPWPGEHHVLLDALCKGYGKPISRLVTPLHFHKLTCWVLTEELYEYKVRVLVKSSGGLHVKFLKNTPGYWLS
jgi:hypothetical protein